MYLCALGAHIYRTAGGTFAEREHILKKQYSRKVSVTSILEQCTYQYIAWAWLSISTHTNYNIVVNPFCIHACAHVYNVGLKALHVPRCMGGYIFHVVWHTVCGLTRIYICCVYTLIIIVIRICYSVTWRACDSIFYTGRRPPISCWSWSLKVHHTTEADSEGKHSLCHCYPPERSDCEQVLGGSNAGWM